jgi:lipoteichoic acid synthase
MKGVALFAVFVVAKLASLAAHELTFSLPLLAGLLWQDAVVALGFGVIARRLPQTLATILYGICVGYVALNVPVMILFGSPLTWTMFRAAGGPLRDSVQHHLTGENLSWMGWVLGCGLLFWWGASRAHARPGAWQRRMAVGLTILAVGLGVLGPRLDVSVTGAGMARNPLLALATTAIPRRLPQTALVSHDWRASLLAAEPGECLDAWRGQLTNRNIILIALESTGARALPTYGGPADTAPHLTELARNALIFESAYAVYPESIKGLFSVLCSRYPALDTATESYYGVRSPALPQILRTNHYRTALFHSGRFMYLGMKSIIENRGYEVLADAGDIGGNHNSSFGVDEPATVASLLAWIDSLSPADRFFVTYLPIAGHHPYDSPSAGPYPDHTETGRYYNSIRYGDQALGTLFDGLRQRGRFNQTLFVIFGDHGEAFGEHPANYGHTLWVYEENVRVPLLIAAPGSMEGSRRITNLASLIDLAPTILDLVGLKTPVEHQGRSLLRGEPRNALFYTDYSLGLLGLREGPWKFIYELESGRPQLFDLKRDPAELQNLSREHPVMVKTFQQHLLHWSGAQRRRIQAHGD